MNHDIEELVSLLTCGDLSPPEAAERAAQVRSTPTASTLCNVLNEYLVEGDTPNEIHELVHDAFAESFPPFPLGEKGVRESTLAYFRWLDSILGQRGYAMICVPFDTDERVRLFLVKRQDVPRILVLARQRGLRLCHEKGGVA